MKPFTFPKCPSCFSGFAWTQTVDCTGVPGVTCEHMTHYRPLRCRWCRGSGRADVFTAIWRYFRG